MERSERIIRLTYVWGLSGERARQFIMALLAASHIDDAWLQQHGLDDTQRQQFLALCPRQLEKRSAGCNRRNII